MRKLGVEAGPDGKESSDQFQGLLERGGGRIRTEVNGSVFLDPPDDG